MSTKPTDAEIESLYFDHVGAFSVEHPKAWIIAALRAGIQKWSTQPAPDATHPYHESVNIEKLQRACRAMGMRTNDSLEAFVSPDVHADHVNRLTEAVAKYVLTKPEPMHEQTLDDDALLELAHSANEEALSFGLSVDLFNRYFRTIRNKSQNGANP